MFTSNAIAVNGNGSYTSAPAFTPAAAGVYRWIASYSGDAANAAVAGACNAANENVTLTPVTPAIATTASAGGPAGTVLTDQATLSGGVTPTGSITFRLYGPNDATCTGTPVFTSNAVAVNGNGTYTSAPGYTANAIGVYRWIASYSGDAANAAVAGACNDANENATITPATPALVTTASAGGPIGTVLTDQATLSGGASPTGSITFRLYGPNDATCTGAPVFTSNAIAVNGNGSYTSAPGFTSAALGTYRWIASYSGDANNAAIPGACNGANESATITTAAPALVTTASAGGLVGTVLTDQATLSGGVNPTGSITFRLYGPSDASCTGAPVFTSNAIAVNGNGTYASAPGYTSTAVGTYRWIASYSGDANNVAIPGACNGANESVTITQPPTEDRPDPDAVAVDAACPGPAARELRARCRAQNGALRDSAPAGSRNRSARHSTKPGGRGRGSDDHHRARAGYACRAREGHRKAFRRSPSSGRRRCRSRSTAAARSRPCPARAGSRSSRGRIDRRHEIANESLGADRRARARSTCQLPPASSRPGNGPGATTRAG